jgi:uncharacterized DUF497 family protein
MKFEWDRKKENINIKKHGVSFEQASYVFADPFALNRYDEEHSEDEERWILLGKSLNQTILLVAHTFRDNDGKEFVRIISARRATKREVSKMKEEYDFTNAEQGRFYRPMEELEIPIYLDRDIREVLMKKLKERGNMFSLNSIVNALIKQDIEISRKIAF